MLAASCSSSRRWWKKEHPQGIVGVGYGKENTRSKEQELTSLISNGKKVMLKNMAVTGVSGEHAEV